MHYSRQEDGLFIQIPIWETPKQNKNKSKKEKMMKAIHTEQLHMLRLLVAIVALFILQQPSNAQDISKTLTDSIMSQDSIESSPQRSQDMEFTEPPTFSDNVIYPFPSSSVFKKYTGSQPSLSTGTVNIPISLYELKYRNITIPFTLRYNTSGIKVFDESYPTGLGWTMTPGLRLTRQIMHRPDEQYQRIKYSSNISALYDSLFLASLLVDKEHPRYNNVDYVDSQHDIFTLYLIDDSYTFVMQKNADGSYEAIGDGLSGLRIDTDNNFSHFTVTDNSGIKYCFGNVTEYREIPENVTAWMLDSITLVNGDVLSFSWGLYYHCSEPEISSSILIDEISTGTPGAHATYIPSTENLMFQPTSSEAPHAHITSVQFPTGSITFNYKSSRKTNDPYGRYPTLETMQVINCENETVKRIELTYDSASVMYQFLESVRISDEGTYSFDYNKVSIPYNHRYAQDWWGYYNGMTCNLSRVPQIEIKTSSMINGTGMLYPFGEGNRSVNANDMQANILTCVHYPLGGTSTFEYEPNTWKLSQLSGKILTDSCNDMVFSQIVTGGGLRVKRIIEKSSASATPVIKEYKYGTGEDGMAECVAMPFPHTFINSRRAYNHLIGDDGFEPQFHLYTYRETQINPESQYIKWHINEVPVWYKEVTEYKGGGKTVYTFEKKCHSNSVSKDWGGGYPIQIRTLSSKGIMNKAIEQYSYENGTWIKLSTRTFNYDLISGPQLLTDFDVKRKAATNVEEQTYRPDVQCGEVGITRPSTTYPVPFEPDECYQSYNYRIEFYTEQLRNVCDTLFTPSGNRVATEIYSYAPHTELVTAKISVVNGDTIREEIFNYPFQTNLQLADGQQLYMDSLVNANRISSPCAINVTRDGLCTKTITEYGSSGGIIMPSSTIMKRNNSQRIMSAFRYDNRGNILEINHDNGFRKESFLWGYGNELPVAAIAGKNYAQVVQALGSGRINTISQSHAPAPENIRTDLSDALLQTYGYYPLVGLSMNRDFKGAQTTFSYDNAYRLESITDGNGSTVERYSYNTYSDNLSSPAHGNTPEVAGNNHIMRRSMLDGSGNSYIDAVQFFDGLGREELGMIRDFWQGGALATLQTYDSHGHADRKWLPVPVSGNGYVEPSQIMAQGLSAYNNSRPYTENTFLSYPTDSIIAVYGPGSQWAEKGVTAATFVNNVSTGRLSCAQFKVGSDGSLVHQGQVAAGILVANETTDEDGHTQFLFSDAEGRIILSRAELGDTLVDTYYVYDGYGQLCYVLPPEASKVLAAQNGQWNLNNETINKYCFVYRHNDYGECIEKKLPGCESIFMHYDRGGRLVLLQDGNLRQDGSWRIMLYDKFGRQVIVMTGRVTDPEQWASAAEHASFTGSGSLEGYAINWEIPSSSNILQVNYYDNYDFLNSFAAISDSLAYVAMTGYDNKYQGASEALAAKGMLTGTATRVLNHSGDGDLLVSAMYYDLHGNVIQSHEQNNLGGYEHHYYHLTFTGKPLKVKHVHETADTTLTDVYQYTYDNMERPLTTMVSHDGGAVVTLASNTYNGLGQLTEQSLGGHANGVVDYTYNVRGWTQGISSPHFSQTLYYEQPGTGATPCYNGNVSAVDWTALDAMATATPTSHRYAFDYDGLNRLSAAHYGANGSQSVNGSVKFDGARNYSATYEYDMNSNITSLTRKGVNSCITVGDTAIWSFGDIDNLSLTYNGNQLKKVTDQCADLTYAGAMDFKDGANNTEEYLWDTNGNMTRDRNKKIWTIKYNVLNLPEQIEYMDGHIVQYTYAADGRKLKTEYQISNVGVLELNGLDAGAGTTMGLMGGGTIPFNPPGPVGPIVPPGPTTYLTMDYCGGHIYRNGVLECTMNDYGYQADSTYYYYITDYQGNVRAVIDQNGSLKEINNYYPYGGLMGAAWTGVQPHKYGGKELDRQNGIDWYDFEARYQDPMLPMFTTQDPLAEKMPDISPYVYCAGNPIRFIDPNGMDTVFVTYNNSTQKWSYSNPILSKGDNVFVINVNGKKEQIIFSNKQYGEQVSFLNLDVGSSNDGYTLGVYHIAGSNADGATGFYVAPGGRASNKINSGCRVEDGDYPMTTPGNVEEWRQPGLGGEVAERGIKIHFGGNNARKWTRGCFVIFPEYDLKNNNVIINRTQSEKQLRAFDEVLGANDIYDYQIKKEGVIKNRIGALFNTKLQRTISVKTWQ